MFCFLPFICFLTAAWFWLPIFFYILRYHLLSVCCSGLSSKLILSHHSRREGNMIVWGWSWAYRTSCPHQRGWSSSGHRVGRSPGPPGSSVRYPGSTRPQRHSPGVCRVRLRAPHSHPWGREPAPTPQTWWDDGEGTTEQGVEGLGVEELRVEEREEAVGSRPAGMISTDVTMKMMVAVWM